MPRLTPETVIEGTVRILDVVLPRYRRTPGAISDQRRYSKYRRALERMLTDLRAAARSESLALDLAEIAAGYEASSSDPRAVIRNLDGVTVALRSLQPVDGASVATRQRRRTEILLSAYLECLALAAQGRAIATIEPVSYEETVRLSRSMTRTFDLGIERAADLGLDALLPSLRETRAAIVRDLVERGRPLARVSTYETAVPLPAVVLAHLLYQDAARADDLRAMNPTHEHPAFMPTAGQAFSR